MQLEDLSLSYSANKVSMIVLYIPQDYHSVQQCLVYIIIRTWMSMVYS